MNPKLSATVALLVMGGAGLMPSAAQAQAQTALVNFETTPSLPTAPSIYIAVPAAQTIVTAPATFSGGVVLGFATFFPAIAFATVPNVYGTADFGNHLSTSLTIDTDPAFTTTEVSFALFNGEVFNQTYTIHAFNGANLVATQTLTSLAPNFNSGYGLVDLLAPGGISQVVITPTGKPAAWDFLIDTVGFNQNIASVLNLPPPVVQPAADPVQGHVHGHGEPELVEVNFGDDANDIRGSVLVVTPAVPEPSSVALMVAGLLAVGLRLNGRRQVSTAG